MKKHFYTLTFLIILVITSAQGQTIQSRYDSAKTYFNEANYAAVIPVLERLIPVWEDSVDEKASLGEMHNVLGISYLQTGNTDKAKKAFNSSASIYESIDEDTTYYNHATAYNQLGTAYYQSQNYDSTIYCFTKSMALLKEIEGDTTDDYFALLENNLTLYTGLKNFKAADSLYEVGLGIKEKQYGKYHLDYARLLSKRGKLNNDFEHYETALQQLTEAEIIFDSIKVHNQYFALALSYLAQTQKALGQYNEAVYNFKRIIAAFEGSDAKANSLYINAITSLAGIYRNSGNYLAAKPLYHEADSLVLAVVGAQHPDYADLLNNYALLFSEMSQYDQAKALLEQSLDITLATSGRESARYAFTLNNLGDLNKTIGQYDLAENYYKQALEIRKKVLGNGHPDYAISLNNLAALYQYIGRSKDAEPLYQEALNINKQAFGETHPRYALTLNNLAGLYENMGQSKKAAELYASAIDITKSVYGENHPNYAAVLNNLALLKYKNNELEEAEKLYGQTLNIYKSTYGQGHPAYASALSNMGSLYEKKARYEEALETHNAVLQIRKQLFPPTHPDYTATLNHLANVHDVLGNYDKAKSLWLETLQDYNDQIENYFPSLSEEEKAEFFNTIKDKLEQFNSFAIRYADKDPDLLHLMYDNQIKTKGLLFEASAKLREVILNSANQELIAKFTKWQQTSDLLAKSYSYTKEELEKEHINLDSLKTKANELEKELSLASTLFEDVNKKEAASWKSIQEKLKDGEAALEIIRFVNYKPDSGGTFTNHIYYAVLILTQETTDNPKLALLKNGDELESKYMKFYRNSIYFEFEEDKNYHQFWERITKELPENTNMVYLSPSGVYNQINLNCIQNPESKEYIIDEVDIRYLTNTKDLLVPSKQETVTDIELFGNPDFTLSRPGVRTPIKQLPGAEKEVNAIGELMTKNNWKVNIYTGKTATEARLKDLKNVGILHIATHGFFEPNDGDTKNPLLQSGILLTGAALSYHNAEHENNVSGEGEDGILTALEAMNLHLDKTMIVFLSACETGLGEVVGLGKEIKKETNINEVINNGEGVYGLQRAFRIAGSDAVGVSLWKVSDEVTQKLMLEFYKEWLKTKNKYIAFKNAQIKVRKEHPSPGLWGAFIIVGSL